MQTTSLKNISTTALDNKLKSLKSSENGILAELILHLYELDERKAYRELGYSSLFTYCTEALGYSESSAYRRSQAARILKTNPEIYELIKTGKLSICSVSEIAKVPDNSKKIELIETAPGKSKAEVKLLVAQCLPPEKVKKESIRAKVVKTTNDSPLFNQNYTSSTSTEKSSDPIRSSYTFTVEVQDEFMSLYQEAKALIGHVPASEVFRRCMKEFVAKRKTVKRKVAKLKNAENKSQGKSKGKRFVPKTTKVEIRERDNNQCTFVAADGKRCTETHGLEFDHIHPTSAGGSTEINNLRLVCRAHNLLHAERFFGKEKIRQYSL